MAQQTHVRRPPFVCTQQAGEVMVVPRFWWHATLNGAETLALGSQEGEEDVADIEMRSSSQAHNVFEAGPSIYI